MRILAAALLALAFATPARADEVRAPEARPSSLTTAEHRAPLHQVLVDVLLVRPIGLPVTAVLGGGFWLLGAPVFWASGDLDWWTDVCLEEPIRQHVKRPLGAL